METHWILSMTSPPKQKSRRLVQWHQSFSVRWSRSLEGRKTPRAIARAIKQFFAASVGGYRHRNCPSISCYRHRYLVLCCAGDILIEDQWHATIISVEGARAGVATGTIRHGSAPRKICPKPLCDWIGHVKSSFSFA